MFRKKDTHLPTCQLDEVVINTQKITEKRTTEECIFGQFSNGDRLCDQVRGHYEIVVRGEMREAAGQGAAGAGQEAQGVARRVGQARETIC